MSLLGGNNSPFQSLSGNPPPPAPMYDMPSIFKSGAAIQQQAYGVGPFGGTLLTGGGGVKDPANLANTALLGS